MKTELTSHIFRVTGWHNHYPILKQGKGIYLYDTQDKCYLDAIGGTHVNTIGYGVAEIGQAMAAQAEQISFVHKAQFTSEPQEALASLIAKIAPEGMNQVTFATGGSTANEMAMQIAHYYQMEKGHPHRRKIIARWQSYHGRTFATLGLSGNIAVRRTMPLIQIDFPHINSPYCYRCPLKLTYPDCKLACAEELATTIEQEGPENIAAFIAEPIIGGAGSAIVPPKGYYERIREICDVYDILFIAEEVITGFARTGKYFGSDHWQAIPDIITTAKGLSSGYAPISAIIVHDKVSNTLINGKRQGIPTFVTYSGHPISCAAALAVQNYLIEHDLINKAVSMGHYLYQALEKLAARESLIGNIRGKGLMLGVEFVKNPKTHEPFPRSSQLLNHLIETAFNHGLILRGQIGSSTSMDGDHILITPPLIINEKECDELVHLLEKSIATVKKTLS